MADLISRAAAMDVFMGKPPNFYHTSYIVGELNCVPAVDAVPVVHARWILVQNGSGVCSACNRNDHIDPLAAYCRYCGAKMDGEART